MSVFSPHPYPAQATRVITVRGDDRAVGRQHAEQLGDCVKNGMAKFYYDMWKKLTETRPSGAVGSVAVGGAVWAIDKFLVGKLERNIPEPLRQRLLGVADVTGLPYRQLVTATVLPDLMPMLQSYLVKLQPARFLDAGEAPRFGCSSFLSSGDKFLVGRNLDFPGVSFWDRYPVLQLTEIPGRLRYLGFASAGVPIAGITGVNEAQVSVHLHQHYCRRSSLSGTLPFVIAEEMLGSARTAKEALEILGRHRVASSWAFIVADGKTREGFIAEAQPGALGVRHFRRGDAPAAHANYYQTAECRPNEYATTERMNWDNYWRKTRLEELVKTAGDGLNPQIAVQCMSDHFDGFWGEEKAVNRTVSQLYNIQSLVTDLEAMRVYFAEGDAPIQLRDYREYDLGAIFAGREGRTEKTYPAYRFKDPKKASAKEAYVQSFIVGFDGKFELALAAMEESLAADYSAEAALVGALLRFRLGDVAKAHEELSRAKRWIEEKLVKRSAETGAKVPPPPEYFEIGLYLARACDLLGRREEALAMYGAVASHPDLKDANLRQLAKRAGPYRAADVKRIVAPYSSYIPFT